MRLLCYQLHHLAHPPIDYTEGLTIPPLGSPSDNRCCKAKEGGLFFIFYLYAYHHPSRRHLNPAKFCSECFAVSVPAQARKAREE